MEDFINGAVQNGFAIAAAAYLLTRVDRRLEELAKAVNTLVSAIDGMERALLSRESSR